MQSSEPVRRTSEIEDLTNLYCIHAMSNRLTPLLAKLHVRPNAVSIAGMACGILAGFAYFHYQNTYFAISGFVLMIAWHVMDGADGQLARLTRSQSESGKVLDGMCDYVTFVAVYAGLALNLSRHHHGWIWGLAAAAGVCHAVQSAAYEAQRQEYDYWGWDRASKAVPRRAAVNGFSGGGVSGVLHRLYARIQRQFSLDSHQRLEEIFLSQPDHAGDMRRRYRKTFAQPVRRWSVLSANTRTIAIFVCALLKAPMLYFFFEIIGLTLIYAVLAIRQRARTRKFLDAATAAMA